LVIAENSHYLVQDEWALEGAAPRHQCQQQVKVVVRGGVVVFDVPAELTAMCQDDLSILAGDADWLHQAAAVRGTVARMDIDVLAPQAARAVVGVSIAADGRAAVFAGKIFDPALELAGH
jgi:hypothetical protein